MRVRKLSKTIELKEKPIKEEETLYMLGLHEEFSRVAVVSLGNKLSELLVLPH